MLYSSLSNSTVENSVMWTGIALPRLPIVHVTTTSSWRENVMIPCVINLSYILFIYIRKMYFIAVSTVGAVTLHNDILISNRNVRYRVSYFSHWFISVFLQSRWIRICGYTYDEASWQDQHFPEPSTSILEEPSEVSGRLLSPASARPIDTTSDLVKAQLSRMNGA